MRKELMSIKELSLPYQIEDAFNNIGITTIEQLCELPIDKVLEIYNSEIPALIELLKKLEAVLYCKNDSHA